MVIVRHGAPERKQASARLKTEYVTYASWSPTMGMWDIWRATRDVAGGPWKPPTIVTELQSAANEVSPSVSLDGLTLVFASNRLVATDFDLYMSTRMAATDPWSMPIRIDELVTSSAEGGPCLSADGLTIYFHSDRNSGLFDIYQAHRPSPTEPFGLATSLNINVGTKMDIDTWISPDDRHLFFTSNRNQTFRQVFEATR